MKLLKMISVFAWISISVNGYAQTATCSGPCNTQGNTKCVNGYVCECGATAMGREWISEPETCSS